MSREDHTFKIEEHLAHDFEVTLRGYGYQRHGLNDSMWDALVEDLVRDAMHQVDKALDGCGP